MTSKALVFANDATEDESVVQHAHRTPMVEEAVGLAGTALQW